MKNRSIVFIFLFFTALLGNAQTVLEIKNSTTERSFLQQYDKFLNDKNSTFHTNVKPYLGSPYLNSLNDSVAESLHLKKDSLDNKPFDIGIELFAKLQPAYDIANKDKLVETYGGMRLHTSYKNKFYACVGFLNSSSDYPSFLDTTIKYTHFTPGIGPAYQKKQRYSSENYFGYVSYSPNKIFNLQAGKDKHFWGDGYRSLFLSDFAPSFPYFRTTVDVWKIKYTVMYAAFKDAISADGIKSDFKNKFGTLHYLSWNICKRLNVGFFESIIWQGADSNRSRSYDVNYLNPVIFFRPIEYSLGSSDNAFLGFSFKIKAFKKQQFYGQIILDEFLLKEVKARRGWWANKQGIQLGFRSFDLFQVKNLDLQTECNYVRPYTYSHGSTQQNYGHLNHPLAHPLGANFMEGIGMLNYRYKKWGVDLKGVIAIYGTDSAGKNMGQNIFASYASRPRDYGNFTTQGVKNTLTFIDLKIRYLLAFTWLEAGVTSRMQSSVLREQNNLYFYFSLKAPLWNEYRDF